MANGRKEFNMNKVNLKSNIQNLKAARTLLVNSYADLKNIKEFRDAGSMNGTFLMFDIYQTALEKLDQLLHTACSIQK